ncbi:MAG TPA: hypothetical protein VFZ30_11370 [Acidimicrobiales bacterium]
MTLAYLDPGSGSLIASALVGGVAAAGVAAKQARARFSGLGRKRKRDAEFSADAGATAPADETTGTQADESTSVASDT